MSFGIFLTRQPKVLAFGFFLSKTKVIKHFLKGDSSINEVA
jgi:hypothetical protein